MAEVINLRVSQLINKEVDRLMKKVWEQNPEARVIVLVDTDDECSLLVYPNDMDSNEASDMLIEAGKDIR